MTYRPLSASLLALLLLLLPACSDPVGPEAEAPLMTAAEQAANKGTDRAPGQQENTVVDIALAVNAESGEFSVLIEALLRTGLVDALQAPGQRTVFAPTDAAFAALLEELGAGSLDDLDDATLTAVLLYHVAPGSRFSQSVLKQKRIKTLNGAFVFVDGEAAALIDAAGGASTIVQADVPASNGAIHDAILERVQPIRDMR